MRPLLKDQLFNEKKISKIASEIGGVYEEFDVDGFCRDSLEKFPFLELKERIYHIRDMLYRYLPSDYREAVGVLVASLPDRLDESRGDGDFGNFIYAPYGEFVALYGCSDEDVEFSLGVLAEFTMRFSMEFAIREFIDRYPSQTLQVLAKSALSSNYHQRRWASEALRPKLPWAKRLRLEYTKALPILDMLYSDKKRYVTRSVANHINDISKIDTKLAIDTLKRWRDSGRQSTKEMEYITTHSLRTAIKEGDVDALNLLGYKKDADIKVSEILLDSHHISMGDYLKFGCTIESNEDTKLIIDYILHYQTKHKKLTTKVHRLKKIELSRGDTVTLSKRHLFRANMTTRKIYEGLHRVEIQINGKIYGDGEEFFII